MCGIAGYFGQGNRDILEKMTGTLRYRGPDDQGFFVGGNIGLGQRRLAIIDLTPNGHQPMSNEDATVWISFNGEIYNFKNLKAKLKNRHQFRGLSDTEVILHLYEEIGEAVFSQLEGMFAIALYDQVRNRLFLGRDRMGKKPLYYGFFNGTLIFGSELKALLKHPECRKELDLKALNMYLQYEYVPTPHSIFKNIFKLEPGSYLAYDGHKAEKRVFWRIRFDNPGAACPDEPAAGENSPKDPKCQIPFKDAVQELDRRMDQAVKSRLVSDVPLGIFLSGGIDSSAIAYYAQKNSSQKIKTFSIGFEEDSFDESPFARQVAGHLGTEHFEKKLSAQDSLDLIPRIAELLDEPMADASIIPTFLLSKFTREHVTVALGGDGGDELFCGYDTFAAHKLGEYYEKLPRGIRKNIIEKIALNLPTSFKNISFDFKLKKFVSGFDGPKQYRNFRWQGAFGREQRQELFKPEIWSQLSGENEFAPVDSYLAETGNESGFNQLIHLYLRTYMMDDILVKVDRASMYNSLEVRAPMLDTGVVDFVNSLPLSFKMRGFSAKYLLKELMAGKLPDGIIRRKKKGFGIPLADWLSHELKPLVLLAFERKRIEEQGLFDYQYINKILNDHFSRRADNRKLIWTLLVFEMWCDEWLYGKNGN